MRRAGLAILAAAALLTAAVPAWSGDDGKLPPVAELSVSPSAVTAGEPVALDASGSRDPDGTVLSYAWDLDGDGVFERQSGSEATLAHAFESAGTRSVGVRVLDDSGDSSDATASVQVADAPAPEPQPAQQAEPEPAPDAPAADEPAAAGTEPAREKRKPKATRARATRVAEQEPDREQEADRVQAAASQTVSIRDFSFAPRSVTVSVGDTVTWRNTGEEPHTATARDGSFDTGNLNSGQSGSFTFKKAGTVSYFCKPHPFMTATVTVNGGGSGGGGSGGGGGGDTQGVTGTGDAGTGDTAAATDGGSDLPSTGLALGPFLLVGLAMIASGVALRRQCAIGAG